MLELQVKDLSELTDREWWRCEDLTFYRDESATTEGLMYHMMREFELYGAKVILAKQGNGRIVGWALLVPIEQMGRRYGVTRHQKSKAKWCVQIFVDPQRRGRGFGRALYRRARQYDTCPLVWPHDDDSANLYVGTNFVTTAECRRFSRKKVKS